MKCGRGRRFSACSSAVTQRNRLIRISFCSLEPPRSKYNTDLDHKSKEFLSASILAEHAQNYDL